MSAGVENTEDNYPAHVGAVSEAMHIRLEEKRISAIRNPRHTVKISHAIAVQSARAILSRSGKRYDHTMVYAKIVTEEYDVSKRKEDQ